jgi:excisionase family DNA binding protein
MSQNVLVDATELAKQLGQAKSSIYRAARRGVIPVYRAGEHLHGLRFDVEEVKAVLRRPARTAQAEREHETAPAR